MGSRHCKSLTFSQYAFSFLLKGYIGEQDLNSRLHGIGLKALTTVACHLHGPFKCIFFAKVVQGQLNSFFTLQNLVLIYCTFEATCP